MKNKYIIKCSVLALVVLGICLSTTRALACSKDPDTGGCSTTSQGSACKKADGSSGTCQTTAGNGCNCQ